MRHNKDSLKIIETANGKLTDAGTQPDTIRESFPAFHITLVSTLGVSTLLDIC